MNDSDDLSEEEFDVLRLLLPTRDGQGMEERDMVQLMCEVSRLRASASLLRLWEEGKIVMRIVDGDVRYFGQDHDPLLRPGADLTDL